MPSLPRSVLEERRVCVWVHGRVIRAGASSLQLLSTPPPGLLDPMIPGRGCTRQPRASLRLVSLVELRKPPKAREQRSPLRGVAVVRFAPQPVVPQALTGGDAAVWVRLEPRMHNMMMIRSSVSMITSRVEKQLDNRRPAIVGCPHYYSLPCGG